MACLALSAMAVLTACHLAGRIRIATERSRQFAPSKLWVLGCRMLVPMAYLGFVMTVQDSAGHLLAGLLSTFPGMSLTVLVLTHLEAGPVVASRLAKALPQGNLSMISFLAVFRFGCPQLGLAWGTAFGYATALATLVVVERLFRHPVFAPSERVRTTLRAFVARRRLAPLVPSRRDICRRIRCSGVTRVRHQRHQTRFSPRVEAFAF